MISVWHIQVDIWVLNHKLIALTTFGLFPIIMLVLWDIHDIFDIFWLVFWVNFTCFLLKLVTKILAHLAIMEPRWILVRLLYWKRSFYWVWSFWRTKTSWSCRVNWSTRFFTRWANCTRDSIFVSLLLYFSFKCWNVWFNRTMSILIHSTCPILWLFWHYFYRRKIWQNSMATTPLFLWSWWFAC